MDNQKAIEKLKSDCEKIKKAASCDTDIEKLVNGLFEFALSSLEKETPKKVILNSEDDREYEDYICPNCKDILQQRRKGATRITIYKYKFCHNCGQMLDWSET